MIRYLLIDPSLEQAVKGVLANQFGIQYAGIPGDRDLRGVYHAAPDC